MMKIMQVISTIPLIADNGENVSVNTVSPKVVTHPTMEAKNININKNFLMFIYIIITRACAHTDRKSMSLMSLSWGRYRGGARAPALCDGCLINACAYIYSN
jgi:hypothetical protein